jgi:hypothetical protein
MRFAMMVAAWMLAGGVFESRRAAADPPDWRQDEQGILENHVQLTYSERFEKAGEAYFSPDGERIIFQAIETPAEGQPAEEFYAMFLADLDRDDGGRVTGLANIRRISPPGSANTCGWFDRAEPGVVLFATTVGPPTESHPPGYERSSGRYRWMFPPEMRIVRTRLDTAGPRPAPLETLAGGGGAYTAEGALSPDGRHLVYCSLESGQGDIYVRSCAREGRRGSRRTRATTAGRSSRRRASASATVPTGSATTCSSSTLPTSRSTAAAP